MPTATESWPERVMNRLRSSTDEGFAAPFFDGRQLLLSLLLGLLGGLLLGLFLGWVVWPVQWSNTRPAHLEADAKAHFIASVADAYVATGRDPIALETARMRLIGMDEADFATTRTYFANTIPGSAVVQNPELEDVSVYRDYAEQWRLSFESNIRLNNINQLALDLGVPLDPITTAGDGTTQVVEQLSDDALSPEGVAQSSEETVDQSVGTTSSAGAETGSTSAFVDGLGRAAACLTALMLVLGGVYILVRMDQRMNWLTDAFDRVRGRDGHTGARQAIDRGGYEQEEITARPSRTSRRSSATSFDDEYQFERDDIALDPETVHADTEFHAPDGFDEDDFLEEEDDYSFGREQERRRDFRNYDDDPTSDSSGRHTDVGPAAISASPSSPIPVSVPQSAQSQHNIGRADGPDDASMPELPPFDDSSESSDFEDDSWPAAGSMQARHGAIERTESSSAERKFVQVSEDRPSTGRRPARTRRTVLEYTARYKRGERAEYEENQHIYLGGDGADNLGRNVGECGLGINFKNGILLNNPHDVIALDVWLLDKVKPEMLTSVKRILISEYVIERKLEDVIQREIHSDGEPLVPQPGLEFELQGAHLSLNCRILEASYVQEGEQTGVFNALTMQMTVYANM